MNLLRPLDPDRDGEALHAIFGDEESCVYMTEPAYKSVAETIVYSALDSVQAKSKQEPVALFHTALGNVEPQVEVRSRRVGGATYQVPVEVRPERAQALAIRWLITAARGRAETTMSARLSGELMDAANNRGNAVKKREDTHRMADANRAFSHYRW